MLVLLPATIAIRTVGTVNVNLNNYDGSGARKYGFNKFMGGNVFSPLAKFEVVTANTGIGLVHIRRSHNKKFLRTVSQSNGYLTPLADEPEEDQSKRSCTLVEPRPVDGNADQVRLFHVQQQQNNLEKMMESVPTPQMEHGCSCTTVTVEKIRSIVVVKLRRREDYFFWKTLFEDIFKRYKLIGIVTGSEPCPDPFLIDKNGNPDPTQVNPAFHIWHEKDQKIKTWIKSTLSEDVVLPLVTTGVIPSNSSLELWLSLEKRFAVAGVSPEYRRSLDAAALATTDVCDTNLALLESGDLRVLPPIFQRFGKRRAFSGRVVTLKVFEDNTLVMEEASRKGEGRVLVVDGRGSMNRAVTGGILVKCAETMGWAGIVVNGCIRDVDEINECEIGVRALASCPVRPIKSKDGSGEKNVDVNIGGKWIRDGEWLYADSNGILVSTSQLSL